MFFYFFRLCIYLILSRLLLRLSILKNSFYIFPYIVWYFFLFFYNYNRDDCQQYSTPPPPPPPPPPPLWRLGCGSYGCGRHLSSFLRLPLYFTLLCCSCMLRPLGLLFWSRWCVCPRPHCHPQYLYPKLWCLYCIRCLYSLFKPSSEHFGSSMCPVCSLLLVPYYQRLYYPPLWRLP